MARVLRRRRSDGGNECAALSLISTNVLDLCDVLGALIVVCLACCLERKSGVFFVLHLV
jgi:hypothetical protein